jgi:50S ribosomal subunit-associated GTPase HflX
LEAVHDADLILHVTDLTSSTREGDSRVVLATLNEEIFTTTATRPPILAVLNKSDAYEGPTDVSSDGVQISAKRGHHVDELLRRICTILDQNKTKTVLLVPYAGGDSLHQLINQGDGRITSYTEKGIEIEVHISARKLGQLRKAGVQIIACPSSQQGEP